MLQQQYHQSVAVPSSQAEWSLATVVGFAGVDVFPAEKYFRHYWVPILGSIRQQRSGVLMRIVGVDLVLEKNFHHSQVPLPSGSPERCSAVIW